MSTYFENYCKLIEDPQMLPIPVNGQADSFCNLVLAVRNDKQCPLRCFDPCFSCARFAGIEYHSLALKMNNPALLKKGLSGNFSATIRLTAGANGEWAALANQFLKKGSRVFVNGRLGYYQDKHDRRKYVLHLLRFFIDPRDIAMVCNTVCDTGGSV